MATRRFRSALRAAAGAATALVVAYPAAVSAFSGTDPVATIQALDDGGVSRWDKPTQQVAVGDTVRWAYDQALAVHALNVAGYSGPFREPGDPPDDVTFPEEGRFTYSCPVHAGMVGELTVGDPPPATPTPTPTPSVTTTPVATATPTATATPGPVDPMPSPLPAPSGSPVPVQGTSDELAPRLRGAGVRVRGRRLRVRARLDEAATVRLVADPRGRGRTVRTARRLEAGRIESHAAPPPRSLPPDAHGEGRGGQPLRAAQAVRADSEADTGRQPPTQIQHT